MNIENLKKLWKHEESIAHIKGWDFSYIEGRYDAENDLPWNYESLVRSYLKNDFNILNYDTGGGEFLLSLDHPYSKTSATEGYPPNVELCERKLCPLGIEFKKCGDPSDIPFGDDSFDMIINIHGTYDARELYRLLHHGGLFITEQVGENNDRDLVEMVLPNTSKPFLNLTLDKQLKAFESVGFEIIKADEAYRPIKFYDVGAFVWFAHIIEWEFPDFSLDRCFEQLLQMQKIIDKNGFIEGTIHRFFIIARK